MRPQMTLGDLRRDGIVALPIREELRKNLIDRLTRSERILPGIIGYDETVVPELENALLAGHHMVFPGERGQAKSRIIRSLIGLLDPEVPVVAGCAINADPFAPIWQRCTVLFADLGDALQNSCA